LDDRCETLARGNDSITLAGVSDETCQIAEKRRDGRDVLFSAQRGNEKASCLNRREAVSFEAFSPNGFPCASQLPAAEVPCAGVVGDT
uniref:hypothetical protein n=1 Tax=Candidatus Fimivicinus sp. TaxID=3056640 RepID=UPI003FEF9419